MQNLKFKKSLVIALNVAFSGEETSVIRDMETLMNRDLTDEELQTIMRLKRGLRKSIQKLVEMRCASV